MAGDVCSEVADCLGGAAKAASFVEEICSPSGIQANQMKEEAVTAVINDTSRGTKEKTMEWASEALHAAQEADSTIKPILEWKETFQESTEEE